MFILQVNENILAVNCQLNMQNGNLKSANFILKRQVVSISIGSFHCWYVIITHSTSAKKYVSRTIPLDISTAVDKVSHRGLLHKLSIYGNSWRFYSVIKSFKTGRSMKGVINRDERGCCPKFSSQSLFNFASMTCLRLYSDHLQMKKSRGYRAWTPDLSSELILTPHWGGGLKNQTGEIPLSEN